jgi:hypothetical protein
MILIAHNEIFTQKYSKLQNRVGFAVSTPTGIVARIASGFYNKCN